MTEIDRRDDMNSEENLHENFADPLTRTYPVVTESQIRAAWRYISNADNTPQYNNSELEAIKARIIQAAQKNNIELDLEN